MNRTALPIVLILLVQLSRAAENQPPPPGVFPLWKDDTTQGTAFLIDKEYGWFLTAAHAVRLCRPQSTGDSINLLVNVVTAVGDQRFPAEFVMPVAIVTSGYSFLQRKDQDETEKDWVLLAAQRPEDIEFLRACSAFDLDTTQSAETLVVIAAEKRPLAIDGHPKKTISRNSRLGNISDISPSSNGLWQASVKVEDGSSGGPVTDAGTAIGLVVRIADAQRNPGDIRRMDECEFIPAFVLLRALSTNSLVDTPRLKSLLTALADKKQLTGRDRVILRGRYSHLNSIETWVAVKRLCLIEPTPSSEDFYQYLLHSRRASLLIADFHRCLINSPRLTNYLQIAINEMEAFARDPKLGSGQLAATFIKIDSFASDYANSPQLDSATRSALAKIKSVTMTAAYTSAIFSGYSESPNLPTIQRWVEEKTKAISPVFQPNSTEIATTEIPKIKFLVETLKNNPNLEITLKGNVDDNEWASEGARLGEQRRLVMQEMLVGNGVPEDQIFTFSHKSSVPKDLLSHTNRSVGRKVDVKVRPLF